MGLSGGNLLLFCPLINGDLRGLWGSSLPHVPQPRISQRLHPLLSENSDSVITFFGFADYVLSNPIILRAARCEFLGSIRWQGALAFFLCPEFHSTTTTESILWARTQLHLALLTTAGVLIEIFWSSWLNKAPSKTSFRWAEPCHELWLQGCIYG